MRESIVIGATLGLLFAAVGAIVAALAVKYATPSVLWDVVLGGGIALSLISLATLALYVSSQFYGYPLVVPSLLVDFAICLFVAGVIYHLSDTRPLAPSREELARQRDVLRDQVPRLHAELQAALNISVARGLFVDQAILWPVLQSKGIVLGAGEFIAPRDPDPNYQQIAQQAFARWSVLVMQVKEHEHDNAAADRLAALRAETSLQIDRFGVRLRRFATSPIFMFKSDDKQGMRDDLEERSQKFRTAITNYIRALQSVNQEYDKRLADIEKAILDGPK
jgi:hypothetical protein